MKTKASTTKKHLQLALGCSVLIAFSLRSQALDFGTPTAGVQLGIAVTNNILRLGSTNTVEYVVRNASTNAIGLLDTGVLEFDFSAIWLIDSSGKKWDLRPHVPMRAVFRVRSILIGPGDSSKGQITIKLEDAIVPGLYGLQVKRSFGVSGSGHFMGKQEVSSNLLKVRVGR